MRVLGIDSSSACVGIALMVDAELVTTDIWTPPKGSPSARLYDYFCYLGQVIVELRPDLGVVERNGWTRNMKAARALSRYEAATVLALKMRSTTVVEAEVSSARKAALGNGALSKPKAYEAVTAMFPDRLRRYDEGGSDEADAIVMALAGPGLIEGI